MIENLSALSGAGIATLDLNNSNLDFSGSESMSLSLEEFSALLMQYMPDQAESVLKEFSLELDGQSLPDLPADGTVLPLESLLANLNQLLQKEVALQSSQITVDKSQGLELSAKPDLNMPNLTALVTKLREKLNSLPVPGATAGKIESIQERLIETESDFLKLTQSDPVKQDSKIMASMDAFLNGQKSQLLNQPTNQSSMTVSQIDVDPLIPVSRQTGHAESAAKAPVTTQTINVDTPLSKPQWADAFNSRVLLLARDQIQSAQIKINPAELGPVEIRLTVNNDQTHIHFIAQHGEVRDVIEDALPRLREMMGQTGVNLGDLNVSDQALSHEFAEFEEALSEQGETEPGEEDEKLKEAEQISHTILQENLIDHYI